MMACATRIARLRFRHNFQLLSPSSWRRLRICVWPFVALRAGRGMFIILVSDRHCESPHALRNSRVESRRSIIVIPAVGESV